MSLRYQLRREAGSASSNAALGIVVGVDVAGSDGGTGWPFGGGGGASQAMTGLAGVDSDVGWVVTPSSWP